MTFLDKIKKLFQRKEFPVKNVNVAPSEYKVDEKKPEKTLKKSAGRKNKLIKEHTADELKKPESKPYKADTLLEILDSVKINNNDFALEKIQGEAETISSYVKGLIKDLVLHQDFKNEKDKQEQIINSIGKKIKLINNHGMELKNLLANLEDHYYNPLINTLKKVNEKAKKDEIKKLVDNLELDLNLVKILDTNITKVIGYNELFNPEKNPDHKDEIEREAVKRVVHGDLNELLNKILTAIVDRSIGIKAKIEKVNYIETAKGFI